MFSLNDMYQNNSPDLSSDATNIDFLSNQLQQQWGGKEGWTDQGIDFSRILAQSLANAGINDISKAKYVYNESTRPAYSVDQGENGTSTWVPESTYGQGYIDWGNGQNSGWFSGPQNKPGTVPGLGGIFGSTYDPGHPLGYNKVTSWGEDATKQGMKIGWSPEGHGNQGFYAFQTPDGKLHFSRQWGSSSDANDAQTAIKAGLAIYGGLSSLGGALGGAGVGAAGGSVDAAMSQIGGAGEIGGIGDAFYGASGAFPPSSDITTVGAEGGFDPMGNPLWEGGNYGAPVKSFTDYFNKDLLWNSAGGALNNSLQGKSPLEGALKGATIGEIMSLNPAGQLGFNTPFVNKSLNGAINGGLQSAVFGGDLVKSIASGGISGGLSSTNPAKYFNIDNSSLANIVNRGINSFGGSLLSSGDFDNAAKNGIINAGIAGVNESGKYLASSLGDNNMNELPWNDNPAMNASYPEGYQPQRSALTEALQGPGPEMSYAPPNSPVWNNTPFTPYGLNLPSSNSDNTREQPSSDSSPGMSFNLPNMGQVGNWALNNAGDLAGMLYGFMNNRKQQRQLGNMLSSLQGLYSQNSPYAQQLRQSLAAKDAAAGRRSQYANREVQLQSNLAHMASQQIPAMNQMQMGISNLQNRNMMNLLNSAKTMGIWDGLKGMFGGRQQQPQLQAPAYGSNLGGLTNMFDPQGSAMFNPNFTPSQQTNWNGANDDYGNPLGS